jgi:hypothetical protein
MNKLGMPPERSFVFFPIYAKLIRIQYFDQIQFSNGKKVCKLRVSTSIPASYRNYLNKVEPVQLYGYVWVENNLPVPVVVNSKKPTAIPNVKKTITCVKGKVSKKVTGLNPKCPSGYILKR